MKNKILIFVIGVLVGCIIATLGYYIYESVSSKNIKNQMPGGMKGGPNMEQMSPPDGQIPVDGEEVPAKPGEENTDNTNAAQNTQKSKKNKTTSNEKNTNNNSQTQTN